MPVFTAEDAGVVSSCQKSIGPQDVLRAFQICSVVELLVGVRVSVGVCRVTGRRGGRVRLGDVAVGGRSRGRVRSGRRRVGVAGRRRVRGVTHRRGVRRVGHDRGVGRVGVGLGGVVGTLAAASCAERSKSQNC